MKYFIDTEFLNYTKKQLLCKPINTIELISIGIVSEDKHCIYPGECLHHPDECKECNELQYKEYYAISKDFNLKAAWENEWVRENILKPIYVELINKEANLTIELDRSVLPNNKRYYNNCKRLLSKYGKTNKQIAEEIIKFTHQEIYEIETGYEKDSIEFYGYFTAFDYVIFSQLFGTFDEYPKGFPMYFIDLKQELDYKLTTPLKSESIWYWYNTKVDFDKIKLATKIKEIQKWKEYPKQTNEHNALADAKWNYELYKFLKTF